MKNFDSLVSIWQAQNSAPEIDYKNVIAHFNKNKNNFIRKIILGLVLMIIALITILILWLKTPFTYITTHISFLIFGLCFFYYIAKQFKNYHILSAFNCTETPKKYIVHLQKFKQLRHKEYTRNFVFYIVAMGLGFVLYFIEFFALVNTFVKLLSIVFTITWFLGCYFYVKKIFIKREETAINDMLKDLERLKKQFE